MVSNDASFQNVAQQGTVSTDETVDYTIKVDVRGLHPYSTYYYRFAVQGPNALQYSPTGRSKTTPLPTDAVPKIKIAVTSCANMPHGYFIPYRDIGATEDLDVVLSLGDLIYEYGPSGFPTKTGRVDPSRNPAPNKETESLQDYRQRHAQYRTDPDEQRAFQQHPWIVVWDDHEFADNAWVTGAPHQKSPKVWEVRRNAAARAFHEYMPIRRMEAESSPTSYRIYRRFSYGTLADIIMLDTRMEGRDQQSAKSHRTRRIMSDVQETWLFQALTQSTATWKLIGNQVMFSVLPVPDAVIGMSSLLGDTWEGYPYNRDRLLNHLQNHRVSNVIILTGDFHGAVASDIFANRKGYVPHTGQGSVMTEFVTPSITSDTPAAGSMFKAKAFTEAFRVANPGIKHMDLMHHGYIRFTLGAELARAEFWYATTVKSMTGIMFPGPVLDLHSRQNRITSVHHNQRDRLH
jgi:alkaline phosphatase D